MADNMNKDQSNETMQREQTQSSVAGERKLEQAKSDEDRREQGRIDKEGREKSAIGGGEKGQTSSQGSPTSGQSSQSSQSSQTGEPGRSRNELEQGRESDKSRSEPTSR